ncbi:MAG: hypothetical protein MUF83_22465 [Acidimicrobiales bacterium]|nr:hypothetical protein [Acidimicrobiales bacterium]
MSPWWILALAVLWLAALAAQLSARRLRRAGLALDAERRGWEHVRASQRALDAQTARTAETLDVADDAVPAPRSI